MEQPAAAAAAEQQQQQAEQPASTAAEPKAEEAEDADETCGFCRFMKGGGCREAFTVRLGLCTKAAVLQRQAACATAGSLPFAGWLADCLPARPPARPPARLSVCVPGRTPMPCCLNVLLRPGSPAVLERVCGQGARV